MPEQAPGAVERFARERTRHRFTARSVTVSAVTSPDPRFIRLTLSGPDLHDFVSTGPADHARVCFPDPDSGELIAPRPTGPGEDGIVRPEGDELARMHMRDFTPINVRHDVTAGASTFDIDVLRHRDPGPAAAFAARATVGDELVVVGPRGSVDATQDADDVLCVVDETALPAAARWIASVPENTEVHVIADLAHSQASDSSAEAIQAYLRELGGREAPVRVVTSDADDALVAAVRETGVAEGTYLFAAGEAGRLVPLRRWVRRDAALPRQQYAFSGYWKRGEAFFDHHAPIDPADPED